MNNSFVAAENRMNSRHIEVRRTVLGDQLFHRGKPTHIRASEFVWDKEPIDSLGTRWLFVVSVDDRRRYVRRRYK